MFFISYIAGWLALSNNKSGEGTLRVLPSLKLSMAYIMLRPFFGKTRVRNIDDYEIDLITPKFPGTVPGTGQLFLISFILIYIKVLFLSQMLKGAHSCFGIVISLMRLIENTMEMDTLRCCIMAKLH